MWHSTAWNSSVRTYRIYNVYNCLLYMLLVIENNLSTYKREMTYNEYKWITARFILSIGKNRILALELYQAKALHVKLEYPWRQSQLRVNDKKECMENIQCEEVFLEISRELILSLGGGGLSIPAWSAAPASSIWYRIHSSLHQAG